MDIIIATEDELSEQLIESMLDQSARSYHVHTRLRKQGFGYLKGKIVNLNKVAERIPVLLLTDLDQSECLVDLKREWLPIPQSPNLLFRIAVREVESWILADRSAFAHFLKISEAKVPRQPDRLADPKQTLLGLFKHSPRRTLREEVLPRSHSTSVIGLGYNDILRHFVSQQWSTERAIINSPSLNRAWACICKFEPSGIEDATTDL
jgi:hypothetical protein